MYFQSNYTAENSGPTNLNGANGWMISHPGKRPRFIFCCNLQQDGYYKENRHVLQWTCALFYCAILSSKGYKESFFFYTNENLSKTTEISVKFYLPPFISIYILIWVISRRKFIKVLCDKPSSKKCCFVISEKLRVMYSRSRSCFFFLNHCFWLGLCSGHLTGS